MTKFLYDGVMAHNKDDWRADIETSLGEFSEVLAIAGHGDDADCWKIEYLPAPHRPSGLPRGYMAIYCFWGDGEWLKIGKVGANSDARYRSQHYAPGRARSSLAQSLLLDVDLAGRCNITAESCSEWIKGQSHRCNILVPATQSPSFLALLEAYLHFRLKPRYEG
jgi:hypothetical protein